MGAALGAKLAATRLLMAAALGDDASPAIVDGKMITNMLARKSRFPTHKLLRLERLFVLMRY
jgi:hypothetical protein